MPPYTPSFSSSVSHGTCFLSLDNRSQSPMPRKDLLLAIPCAENTVLVHSFSPVNKFLSFFLFGFDPRRAGRGRGTGSNRQDKTSPVYGREGGRELGGGSREVHDNREGEGGVRRVQIPSSSSPPHHASSLLAAASSRPSFVLRPAAMGDGGGGAHKAPPGCAPKKRDKNGRRSGGTGIHPLEDDEYLRK